MPARGTEALQPQLLGIGAAQGWRFLSSYSLPQPLLPHTHFRINAQALDIKPAQISCLDKHFPVLEIRCHLTVS